MIYVHSMGRAVRYYPQQPALTLSDDSWDSTANGASPGGWPIR
jgi:hypothetical protein